ncbi:hypothetical protein ACFVWN_20550 [Nocardiopsis flavescens]|uniref:hypothetical protein n=1 Tax=Nocardiopsis flavescens TaxID=758803 RepID=UPI00365D16E5
MNAGQQEREQLAYTPEEAAQRLACTESWLRDQAKARKIPWTRISGSVRFTPEHLRWILDHFEVAVRPEPTPKKRRKRASAPKNPDAHTASAGDTPVVSLTAKVPRRRREYQERAAQNGT